MSKVQFDTLIAYKKETLADGSLLVKYLNERTGFVTDISRATHYSAVSPLEVTRNAYIAGCDGVISVACEAVSILNLVPAALDKTVISNIGAHLGLDAASPINGE